MVNCTDKDNVNVQNQMEMEAQGHPEDSNNRSIPDLNPPISPTTPSTPGLQSVKSDSLVSTKKYEELFIENSVLQSTVNLLKRELLDAREELHARDRIIAHWEQKFNDLEGKVRRLEQLSHAAIVPLSPESESVSLEVSVASTSPPEQTESLTSQAEYHSQESKSTPVPIPPLAPPVEEIQEQVKEIQKEIPPPEPPERRCSICLQTDLIEDPDIYYFAGGRHVGSQTEDDEDFGPLEIAEEQFKNSTAPVVIVQSFNELGDSDGGDLTPSAETQTQTLPPQFPELELNIKEATSTTTADKAAQSPRIVNQNNSKDPPTFPVPPSKSTFAEKAKKGMTLRLSQGQTQSPAVPVAPVRPPFLTGTCSSTTSRNRIVTGGGVPPAVRPNSASGSSTSGYTRPPPPANYRSNIASRYRTAAATKQQQQQVGQQASSPTTPRTPTSNTSTNNSAKSPSMPMAMALSRKSFTSSSHSLIGAGSGKSESTTTALKIKNIGHGDQVQVSGPQLQAPASSTITTAPSRPTTINTNQQQNQLLQLSRSKSMINPPTNYSNSSKRASSSNSDTHNQHSNNRPTNKNLSRFSMAHQKNSNKTSSCTSILEVLSSSASSSPVERKRVKVGDDGWETVQRARTNRSRWSLSSCSSSTNEVGANANISVNANVPEKPLEQQQNSSPISAKEVPPAPVSPPPTDDESIIKETEAALDSALREEEAIEKELLQVERDFEEIENLQSNMPPPSPSPSPDLLLLLELDDEEESSKTPSYFIDIVNQKVTKGTKDPEFSIAPRLRDSRLLEKLMSPAKKPDSAETLRRHQAKLEKAERNRETLLQSKYTRYVELSDKFKVLNANTTRLLEERSELITKSVERRKRAEEKREQYLEEIKRKAHDEGEKTKEIAFINLIELKNKNYDYNYFVQTVESRLQSLEEERQAKLKERQTKTMAVLEKQNRIRSNWEAKLSEIQARRQKTQERILREKQERAKERHEIAQERARDHSQRISALNAAQRAKKEELANQIIQKQEATARRHEENMENIRQKAIELSHISCNKQEEENLVRICTLCHVIIQSEVQELTHLRGRSHLEAMKKIEMASSHSSGAENFGLKFISDILLEKWDGKERLHYDHKRGKIMKKHCKKLIGKMSETSVQIEKATPSSKASKSIQKNMKEIDRLVGLFENGKGTVGLATSLERLIRELMKSKDQNHGQDDGLLLSCGLVEVVQKILGCKTKDLPPKVIISSCQLLSSLLSTNFSNTIQVLQSSLICNLLELISTRWNALVPDDSRWLSRSGSPVNGTGINHELLPVDPVLESATDLLFTLLNIVPDPFNGIKSKANAGKMDEATVGSIQQRTLDIIGYVVCSGIVDRLAVYCTGIRGPVESQPGVGNLLKGNLDLITLFIYALGACFDTTKKSPKPLTPNSDPTQLLSTLESSELAGSISMSYSLLLYQGAPTRPRQLQLQTPGPAQIPPPPTLFTSSLVRSTFCLINALAKYSITFTQEVLAPETVSLQFRHIASQLLWQVVPHRKDNLEYGRLLNELLDSLGYFTIKNQANQITIQSGQTPTVFQQLCSLPEEYFENPKLSSHFYPALIAGTIGCEQNVGVLKECNIQPALLNGFLKSKYAKFNPITKILFLDSDNPLVEEEFNRNGNSGASDQTET